MRVCIVGGTGNISSSFLPLLLQMGHEVTLFNRGKSDFSPGVADGKLPRGVKVISGDRHDRAAFEKRMQAERFDYAIDMICYTRDDALSTLRAFQDVKHLVHCSTVCTYGVEYDFLPATEDHPLRPISDYGKNKVLADHAFLAAYHDRGFPVTIIKPSSTYGPKWAMLRQIAWADNGGWVGRVRAGKPIVVCGDGKALHQFLYVDDAAPAFVFPLGRSRCIGQTYNMMRNGHVTWNDYHRTAMKVIGREVEIVGVPLANILAAKVPGSDICRDIFAHNVIYSSAKLMRDVPEFNPRVSLEAGLSRVYEAMKTRGIANDSGDWEDRLIDAQRRVM